MDLVNGRGQGSPKVKAPAGTEAAARNHALLFVGTHEQTFDKQGRVTVPAEFRQQLEANAERYLYSVVFEGPTLAIYPETEFHRLATQLEESDHDADAILEYQQRFFASACRLECAAQGRIRVPPRQLEEANLGKDVLLLGMRDHIEIRDRQQWQEQMESQKTMLVNPSLMKKRGPRGKGPRDRGI